MNKQKDIYIFLGPPGSGKGSLSQLCRKRLGWQQLSTGNLCREHIAKETEIGKKIDFAIKSGKLISDSLIVDMVHEWLATKANAAKPVIFDGFPRTVLQARILYELVKNSKGIRLHLVQLTVPDEEIVYRLSARSICKNNECQCVYSLHKHSALQPRKEMTCNECESPLVCRTDDEESAIYERLRIYHQHERAMLDFFGSIGHSIGTIRADAPLEDVYKIFLDIAGYVGI